MDLSSYTAINGNRALADALGVSQSLISQWKTGHRRISPETAARIERATNGLVTRAELRPDIFGPIDANPERADGVTSPPPTGEPPDGGSATNRLQEVDG